MEDHPIMNDAKDLAARSWFGYGRWDAPYWFLGMEPGGTDKHASYEAWIQLGGTDLVDCREHHLKSNFKKWHTGEHPPTQPTWRRLIQLLLSFKGESSDLESVRAYQKNQWGSVNGETAILEVSAFHAKSLGVDVDRITHRKERIATLGKRLKEEHPLFVVMYGGYRDLYEEIAGESFKDGYVWQGTTLCALVEHPVARPRPGRPWTSWIEKGKRIRSMVQLARA